VKFLTALFVVALLTGCDGQSARPSLPQSVTERRARGASGSNGDLLYVPLGFHLSIYSYPDLKRIRVVDLWPLALGLWTSSDPKTGDVCFDNYAEVLIFKHGATSPYVTIAQPPSAETIDCALDPATNDLAITYSVAGSNDNWVAVYKSPYNGSPKAYSDPGMAYMQFAGYDADGDLFIDGESSPSGCECLVDELAKGSGKLIELQKNEALAPVGPLSWDGQYMTMTVENVIDRFTVSGSTVTVVGKTSYNDVTSGDSFAFQGSTAIGRVLYKGADRKLRHIGFWQYPNGQNPFKIIDVFRTKKDLDWAVGIPAISVAPSEK